MFIEKLTKKELSELLNKVNEEHKRIVDRHSYIHHYYADLELMDESTYSRIREQIKYELATVNTWKTVCEDAVNGKRLSERDDRVLSNIYFEFMSTPKSVEDDNEKAKEILLTF